MGKSWAVNNRHWRPFKLPAAVAGKRESHKKVVWARMAALSIFSPINVGGYWLKNRLVGLPIYTGYAHPGGWVSNLMIDHYAWLAGSGVAMVVVANAAVSSTGILSDFNLRIDRPS
jgi:2,4-dienoyl-CoA reductase-like NADH-dependent reductase (Old Yellow Enzyme family)